MPCIDKSAHAHVGRQVCATLIQQLHGGIAERTDMLHCVLPCNIWYRQQPPQAPHLIDNHARSAVAVSTTCHTQRQLQEKRSCKHGSMEYKQS